MWYILYFSGLPPSVTPHIYHWSNFRLANNNGISRVKRVTCHSTTFISPFRYHFMRACYSDSKSPSVFFFISPSSVIFYTNICIYFSTHLVPPYILFALYLRVVFFGSLLLMPFWCVRHKVKNKRIVFCIGITAVITDNWQPISLVTRLTGTDVALFTGRNDAVPSSWWEASHIDLTDIALRNAKRMAAATTTCETDRSV